MPAWMLAPLLACTTVRDARPPVKAAAVQRREIGGARGIRTGTTLARTHARKPAPQADRPSREQGCFRRSETSPMPTAMPQDRRSLLSAVTPCPSPPHRAGRLHLSGDAGTAAVLAMRGTQAVPGAFTAPRQRNLPSACVAARGVAAP